MTSKKDTEAEAKVPVPAGVVYIAERFVASYYGDDGDSEAWLKDLREALGIERMVDYNPITDKAHGLEGSNDNG